MITIVKGEDKEITVRLKVKDDGPLDLTNKVITVKYKDTANVVQTVAGVLVGTAPQGRFKFSLTDAQTELLKIGNFEFDVYLTEGSVENIYKSSGLVMVKDKIR